MRWMGIEAGGWVMWPILLLAVPGLVLGVLALGHSQRRVRQRLGIAALFVSATLGACAIGGALAVRAREKAAAAAMSTDVGAKRAARAVAIDARIPLRFGLGASLVPLIGGLTGALSTRRLRRGKPLSTRSLRDPRVAEDRRVLALGAAALASGAAIGSASLLLAPLPGPQVPIDSPAWDALEAVELMKGGVTSRACDELEHAAAAGGADPTLVPDARSAASECFEVRFEQALASAPAESVSSLDALVRSPMPFTRGQRSRAEAELRRAKGATTPKAD